jgi:di/tricarboxylate transporter
MGFVFKIVIVVVLLYFGYQFASNLAAAITANLVQIFWWMFP